MFARSSGSLRVLGIDPGLTRCGYAVVDGRAGGSASAVSMGVIRTPAADPLPHRLATLRAELVDLLRQYRPHVVAVEQVFFQVNVRTAMSVGQASGLALCEAAAAGCEVVQYTPNQVKDAVAGYGGADKRQECTDPEQDHLECVFHGWVPNFIRTHATTPRNEGCHRSLPESVRIGAARP